MSNQLEVDVRSAFDRAIKGGESPDELLASVRTLVRELKSEGRPPEYVIVTIKDLCRMTHQVTAADTDSTPSFSETKKVTELVVSAVIDEYYNGTRVGGKRPWAGYALELGDELR
jgi:hypothetical protein